MKQEESSNASMLAGWISLISNIVLTGLKLVVGTIFHSPVLLADGYHNAGDVIASGATLTSMKISKRPADEDHPYGHGKAEVLSSAIVGIILLLAACYIAYESVLAFFHEPEKAGWIAFITAVVSLLWKMILYIYTLRVGKKANSKGLIATAYDHLADVYASLAAVIGIGLSLYGEGHGVDWLLYGDPVAGLVVTVLIFKLSYEMLTESGAILMEKSVAPEMLHALQKLIVAVPEIKRIDRIRAREHGHYILVDLRLSIPGEMSIQEGHDIIREIKKIIMNEYEEVEEVLIHLNPWYEND